jgi:hypothetical protein
VPESLYPLPSLSIDYEKKAMMQNVNVSHGEINVDHHDKERVTFHSVLLEMGS